MHVKIEGSTCGSKELVFALLPYTEVNVILYSSVIWGCIRNLHSHFLRREGSSAPEQGRGEVYIVLMLLSRAACNPYYAEADEVSKGDEYATAFCA